MVAPNSIPEKSDEKETMVEFVVVLSKKCISFYTETRFAVIKLSYFQGFFFSHIYNFSVHTPFDFLEFFFLVSDFTF